VLVLGAGVVEVLGCDDERGQEDAVARTMHAWSGAISLRCAGWESKQASNQSITFRDAWQARPETVEIDERAQQGRDLHVALVYESSDEGLETGQGGVDDHLRLQRERILGRGRRRRRQRDWRRSALYDRVCLLSEIS
jgi:hypothetical protein